MPRAYQRRHNPPADNHPALCDWGERLPDGWELTLSVEQQKQHRFTGARIARNGRRRQAVVEALGLGLPIRWIRDAMCIHPSSIAVIAAEEKVPVDTLKRSNGELMLKAAGLSVRGYFQDLAAGVVDPKTKAIAAGIFSQNGLLMLGEATSIVQTQERPELTIEAVNGFWERVKNIKGRVVEAEDAAKDRAGQPIALLAADSGSGGNAPEGQQNGT